MVYVLTALGTQETIGASPHGQERKRIGSSFFRGEDCNFNPYGQDHCVPDFAQRFLLHGWLPDGPFINATTKVTAFGSCFAENISNHLGSIGFDTSKQRAKDIYVSVMGEGMVNVHAIAQQFKWALDGWMPPSDLWHGYNAEQYDLSEEVRTVTRDVFLNTEVFILTFGLSEIWYDEMTGGVFWRAVPLRYYDPTRHKFRVCSFGETKDNIGEIVKLIKKHVPHAKIIMTVSPIPLIATFRPVSCISANSASKAIIRAALDETMRELDEDLRQDVFYFPAFEIINECFPNRFLDDGRHLHPMIVPSVMRLFEATFCDTELTLEEAEKTFSQARLEAAKTLGQHPLFSQAFSQAT